MKYELIGSNDYLINPIETILKNRGIHNIIEFLNVSEKHTNHWSLLKNIDKAVENLLIHIERGSKLFIQVDSDPDGYLSSTALIKYLQRAFPYVNIQWRIHEGKEHGVIVDTVPNDVKLVILPDAGSNQYEEHLHLKQRGIDVLVLDHHECDKESEYAIVVNNQLSSKYKNKNLSGVGIAYKFLQALDDKLKLNYADDYLDLVAVGNIADMMDLRELETRYYVLKGLSQIKNKFLKALYKQQEFSTKGIVNIMNTAFYIVPLINATIRTGNMQEKLQMMRAFLEEKELIYYKRKNTHEPIEENTARMLVNIRNRQNRKKEKGLNLIEERIQEKNLLKNKVLIVNVTDILEKNLTGLVANDLSKKYKRPSILIRQKEDNEMLFSGSLRGYEKGAVKDAKQFFNDTNLFNFVQGHANAAGVEIEASNLIELNNYVNKVLEDVELDESLYEVDFIIPSNKINENIIKDIYKYRDIWGGNGVDEPLIVVSDISVNADDIQLIGSNKSVLKFKNNGIEYIKFKYSEKEYNELFIYQGNYIIDVVGKFSINERNGNMYPQIIIENFLIKELKEKEFVF